MLCLAGSSSFLRATPLDVRVCALMSFIPCTRLSSHMPARGRAWQDGRLDTLQVSSSVPADPALILLCSGDLEPTVGTVRCCEGSGSCLAAFWGFPLDPVLIVGPYWATRITAGRGTGGPIPRPTFGRLFCPIPGVDSWSAPPPDGDGGPAFVSRSLGDYRFLLPAGSGLLSAGLLRSRGGSCGSGLVPAGARIGAGWAQFWKR
ncbi:hypothetical protein NDU88_002991 [Pleurodeles waltl]|uniref:Uncharacterized protein n=1 Tax=Pleurodeles waltl TaxID=8319 RepID=A0AAV7NIL9_PLEWA|nr:hypothetical protein NDU88_002991 [Pleurodeles waltl]